MIHLDTCHLIHALVPGTEQDRQLRGWLEGGEALAMSAVAWAEFLCGPLASRDADLAASVVSSPVPLDADQASFGARLYNETGRRSGSLLDCLIAAAAISCDAALATVNRADFRRFEKHGLRLSD